MRICHHCLSANVIKKGIILRGKKLGKGKPRYKCKDCKRTFVEDGLNWFVSDASKVLVDDLLLERISLRGICRVAKVSLRWLLVYIEMKYAGMPDDLNCKISRSVVKKGDKVYIRLIDCQADELWSFVYKRDNVKYIWIAMHTQTRQIIAFHAGDRSRASARELWAKIPDWLKEDCYFHTDDWESYKTVIPEDRHEYSKRKKYTNHLERFNNTLRQRCSRLVRETLSFSKKLENHIGAIKYFICHYNLERQAMMMIQ
jgi:insertion element IS1 protein InsB